jgi:hypothetical protein
VIFPVRRRFLEPFLRDIRLGEQQAAVLKEKGFLDPVRENESLPVFRPK